jgi:pilus assembly protein CpaC
MRSPIAVLAVLLLVACACTRQEQVSPQPTVQAGPIDPGPAAQPKPQAAQAPSVAQPEPPPTPEEVAAFHAPAPK